LFDIAEGLADDRLDLGQGGLHLGFQIGGIGLAVGVIVGADLGGDGEARRNRQTQRRHFRQIGALSAEKVLHRRIAVGGASAEAVHPLSHLAVPELCIRSGGFAPLAHAA
jgi:hypothetical protein